MSSNRPSHFTFSAAVESETIKGLAYSEASQTLSVEMTRGPSYVYTGVPKQVACNMLGAESVGGFFATEIRGHYPYLKIGLADQAEIVMKEASPIPLPPPTTPVAPPEEKPFSAKAVEPRRGPGRSRKQ